MSKVRSYSLARLDRMIRNAREEANKIAAHALGLLRKGIEEGVWSVIWDKGQPIFTSKETTPQTAIDEKDEQNQ